jgi:hypothetical protein
MDYLVLTRKTRIRKGLGNAYNRQGLDLNRTKAPLTVALFPGGQYTIPSAIGRPSGWYFPRPTSTRVSEWLIELVSKDFDQSSFFHKYRCFQHLAHDKYRLE